MKADQSCSLNVLQTEYSVTPTINSPNFLRPSVSDFDKYFPDFEEITVDPIFFINRIFFYNFFLVNDYSFSKKHEKLLRELYYDRSLYCGRDKLFHYLTENYNSDHP